ncbi:MAG: FG-GAP repeat domain-containing protein [Kofleriaceae bacterium]
MGRALALVIACIAGCYQSPSLASCKYRCGGANNASCPNGFECADGMCVVPGEQCSGDGGVIDDGREPDSLIDMMTIDAPQCPDPDVNYWTATPTLTTGTTVAQLVVFDGNNDNRLDIAVLDEADGIGFFAGNGDGTFDARQGSTSGANAKRVITGDFDRDGQRDDMIVLNPGSNEMAIMASNGNGTFTRSSFTIASSSVDIGNAGDLDGNGYEDVLILFTPTGTPRIETLLQVNTGMFWTPGTMVATNGAATSMFVGRANAGNSPDAILTLASQVGLHVAVSNNPFTLDPMRVAANVTTPVRAIAGQIRPAPAGPTIVTVSSSAGVFLHHVSGLFTTTAGGQYDVGNNPRAVIVANLIGDALPEIVTADSGSGGVSILLNREASMLGFEARPTLTTDNVPIDLIAGDFDADGRLDLAVAHQGAQTVTVFLNKCTP